MNNGQSKNTTETPSLNCAILFITNPYRIVLRWGRTNVSKKVLCPSVLVSTLLPMEGSGWGMWEGGSRFIPLNSELNPICHLLALLRAHHILNVSRIRVKLLNLTSSVPIQHYCVFASPLGLLPGTLQGKDGPLHLMHFTVQ